MIRVVNLSQARPGRRQISREQPIFPKAQALTNTCAFPMPAPQSPVIQTQRTAESGIASLYDA